MKNKKPICRFWLALIFWGLSVFIVTHEFGMRLNIKWVSSTGAICSAESDVPHKFMFFEKDGNIFLIARPTLFWWFYIKY